MEYGSGHGKADRYDKIPDSAPISRRAVETVEAVDRRFPYRRTNTIISCLLSAFSEEQSSAPLGHSSCSVAQHAHASKRARMDLLPFDACVCARQSAQRNIRG